MGAITSKTNDVITEIVWSPTLPGIVTFGVVIAVYLLSRNYGERTTDGTPASFKESKMSTENRQRKSRSKITYSDTSKITYSDTSAIENLGIKSGSRVAIFGSSANPPTYRGGHGDIIKHMVKSEMFSHILVLPVYEHMFSKKLAPFEHRMQMCILNFKNLSSKSCSVVVTDFERIVSEEMNDANPGQRVGTIDVIQCLEKHLNVIQNNITLHFILGKDTFWDLLNKKWKESDKLLQRLHFEVFERDVNEPADATKIGLDVRYSYHKLASFNDLSVSSTLAREFLLSSDIEKARGLLSDEVFEYIQKNHLYKQ